MKYIALAAVALLIGAHELSHAHGSSHATSNRLREEALDRKVQQRQEATPILTADQAIGFTNFDVKQWSRRPNGSMTVCVPRQWYQGRPTYGVCRGPKEDAPTGDYKWVSVIHGVPAGRTFYGQRIGGRYDNRLDVWWK
ncbi:hypothetical protein [Delftia phage PhiW-14]|uniref:Uncharacterized protein n=1 Tax=Delftia phage PhiW-14 TaxID=665032 RepID=C9DG78_BPW14|nr:hypothetical protein DP-phiW-14_gp108 [Delftia phage PhiW-14]ACV50129.1 hypothetical protein [Delftia phage PhiW-14]